MPLARVRVRNEYGLGAPELYTAANSEDPKAILDGVAVAGLVGILRQLGDLAEFASDIFHDLQEQVLATAVRSRKMTVRVQHIEAALPLLEKAVMSQSCHIHFAYTAGSDWHCKVRTEQNHLIYSDLPQFFVDSYEECRDPPHLHLLDKFDSGGSGACMKRYSDPSFFRRVLASSESTDAYKVQREKKAHKNRRRGSRHRNGEIARVGSIASHSGRMPSASMNIHDQSSPTQTAPLCDLGSNSELQDCSTSFDSRSRMLFPSPKINGQNIAAETVSLFDVRSNFELRDHSSSFDSRNKSGCNESVFHGSSSMWTEEQETNGLVSPRLKMECAEIRGSVLPDKLNGAIDDNLPHGSLQEQGAPNSSFVTWDEKTEIVKSAFQQCDDIVDDQSETSELHTVSYGISKLGTEASFLGFATDSDNILLIDENMPESVTVGNQFDEIESELDNYMDALNTMESEVETDFECQTKREVDFTLFDFENTDVEHGAGKMEKIIGQNSDSSDTVSRTPSYGSLNKEMSISDKVIAAESLPNPEPPQITRLSFPIPEGPARANFCENNEIYNDSRENGFESVTTDPPPFSMPNSLAPLENKIESSLSESCTPYYSSSKKEMSVSDKVIAAENLPDPEPPQIIGLSFPTPEGPARANFYENNDICNDSGENGLESVTYDPPPFSMSNSHAPLEDKIESSLSESRIPSYSSSNKEMSVSNKVIAAESLPDPEPPQITGLSFPTLENPARANFCENNDICNDSGENGFESVTSDPPPFSMFNAHAPLEDNIESSLSESRTPSYSSSNKEMSVSDKVIAAESLSDPEPPQITGLSFPTLEGPARANFCENNDICNDSGENGFESVTYDPPPFSMSNSHAPLGDKIESSLSRSQESNIETSSASPIKLWTNGGLLGLEPLKPLDCSLLNVSIQSSLADTKDGSCDVSRNSVIPSSHSDESAGRLEKELDSVGGKCRSPDGMSPAEDHLVRNVKNMVQAINQSQCSTSCNNKQNDCKSRNEVPFESTAPETNIEKSEVSHNISSHAPDLPVSPVVKTPFDEAGRENTESSSNLFDRGHRLLVNGFRRKASLHEERSEPACSVNVGPVMLQETLCNEQMKGKTRVEHQTFLEMIPKEQTECESPENSPSSSPPLEHMNISFHSINGFETSKLKLKFLDGHHFDESIRDVIFPSFQLQPEPSTLQDIDSESDDDTFCRSSPCTSEDLVRHHSESSSEQWESGDSTGSEDNELHDALHRVSSAESISAFLELEGVIHSYPHCEFKDPETKNGLEHFHSGPSLDLPSFDALNPLMDQHENISSTVPKDLLESQLQYPNEQLSPPPPLPPMQWLAVKPHLDEVEDKQGATSDVVCHPNDHLVMGSTSSQKPIPGLRKQSSQKPIPGPPKQPHINEATEPQLNNEKLNEHREVGTKEVDEREDLLYQIRMKQFSLKRTMPTRQSPTSDSPTNVKVAAILEKANAIRQACVGSDEGGDENWSDG